MKAHLQIWQWRGTGETLLVTSAVKTLMTHKSIFIKPPSIFVDAKGVGVNIIESAEDFVLL